MYHWDFSSVVRSIDILLRGLSTTLLLTAATVAVGLPVGLGVMSMRISRRWLASWPARVFIEVFRDLPVLVVLVWLFYALPTLLSGSAQISPSVVAVMGLALNFAALEAEIIRAGYEAIPRGQLEAAAGLGFGVASVFRFIVVPQAFWRALAPTLGQVINTLKLSSLASFIAVPELFYVTGSLIQETFRPLEFYTAMAILYLAVIAPLAFLLQGLERLLAARFEREQ